MVVRAASRFAQVPFSSGAVGQGVVVLFCPAETPASPRGEDPALELMSRGTRLARLELSEDLVGVFPHRRGRRHDRLLFEARRRARVDHLAQLGVYVVDQEAG